MPDTAGLTDNMLSRTDLQMSGLSLPHGELSPASMFIGLCCTAGFLEATPEQACAIEISTNAKATIDAVMIESFFSMFDSRLLLKTLTLHRCLSITLSRRLDASTKQSDANRSHVSITGLPLRAEKTHSSKYQRRQKQHLCDGSKSDAESGQQRHSL